MALGAGVMLVAEVVIDVFVGWGVGLVVACPLCFADIAVYKMPAAPLPMSEMVSSKLIKNQVCAEKPGFFN